MLRVYGCVCFPNMRLYNKNKLQFRSIQGIFLSYSLNHKGYKCLDPISRLYISKETYLINILSFFSEKSTIHNFFYTNRAIDLSLWLNHLSFLLTTQIVPSLLNLQLAVHNLYNCHILYFQIFLILLLPKFHLLLFLLTLHVILVMTNILNWMTMLLLPLVLLSLFQISNCQHSPRWQYSQHGNQVKKWDLQT